MKVLACVPDLTNRLSFDLMQCRGYLLVGFTHILLLQLLWYVVKLGLHDAVVCPRDRTICAQRGGNQHS